MHQLITAALVLTAFTAAGQVRECTCKSDPEMGSYTTNCKTTLLKNGSKLYWQFNCQRIWLTLESASGKKMVINEVPVDWAQYTFRLGYQLAKEYKNTLLFRSGCPANGPCNFILIDKATGKKQKEFGELVYDHESRKFHDFILYFSSPNVLALHYIDTNKRYIIPMNGKNPIGALTPEYEVDYTLTKDLLLLRYGTDKLQLNLRTYHP